MVSNEDIFYMKVVALNDIYNFLVLSFFIFEIVKIHKKNNIKFQQHNNRVLALVALEK
jgi:hypothetical protein